MDNLHFILNNIITKIFKELTKYKNNYQQYLNFIYIYIYIILYILLYIFKCFHAYVWGYKLIILIKKGFEFFFFLIANLFMGHKTGWIFLLLRTSLCIHFFFGSKILGGPVVILYLISNDFIFYASNNEFGYIFCSRSYTLTPYSDFSNIFTWQKKKKKKTLCKEKTRKSNFQVG